MGHAHADRVGRLQVERAVRPLPVVVTHVDAKDVVELVARTPNAIGYSGLGYATKAVKILKVSKQKGEPAVTPGIETTWDKSYPIARPMFMYCPGTPPPHVQKYLDWIVSDAGQAIVKESGYVPMPRK